MKDFQLVMRLKEILDEVDRDKEAKKASYTENYIKGLCVDKVWKTKKHLRF